MVGGSHARNSTSVNSPFAKSTSRINVSAEQDALVSLVDRILKAKRLNPVADTSAWEQEINERVYRLYGLTAEEIKLVEGISNK